MNLRKPDVFAESFCVSHNLDSGMKIVRLPFTYVRKGLEFQSLLTVLLTDNDTRTYRHIAEDIL